ncbi:MAG: helix-turn-helix transcriptional regulator [Acidobacteriota bacterium]|nr:helix-turn-helix transcriptional regulator [Acidobacteriota bacterium]
MGARSNRAGNEIIGRIYEAAEDPLIWSEVLRLLGNQFGSTVNVFTLNDKNSPLSEVAVSDGADPKWEKEYNDYYYSTNVVFKRLTPLLIPGQVISSAEAISDTELLSSEYCQDFLRRRDVFYLLGSVVNATATSTAVLTLARSRKSGPWSAADKDALAFLTPHLTRAVRLSANFARVRQERDEILNRLPMGVIVLGESGGIEFLNHAAQVILEKKDGLRWSPNGISAVDTNESAQLGSIISGAKSTAAGKGTEGGGSLSISRSSGSRPYSVMVAPLRPTPASHLSETPRIAIFISDPEAAQQTNLECLAATFGLTPAESRLADHFTQGKSLAESAEALGITQETARVHLKRIFEKTYTHRQGELMRLLLSSPAALRD